MKESNLLVSVKRACQTTRSLQGDKPWTNRLETLEVSRQDQVWVADITYIGLTQNELTYRLLLLTMVCEEVNKDDETHSCRLLSVFTQHTHQLHTDTFRRPFGDFQS